MWSVLYIFNCLKGLINIIIIITTVLYACENKESIEEGWRKSRNLTGKILEVMYGSINTKEGWKRRSNTEFRRFMLEPNNNNDLMTKVIKLEDPLRTGKRKSKSWTEWALWIGKIRQKTEKTGDKW